jgi:Domain of unknown function (DUF4403)
MRPPLILSLLAFLALGAYLLWPQTAHINPALPQPGFVAAPKPQSSSILVPIEVEFSDLGALIDSHFPDGEVLHRGRKQQSKSLSYRYTVRRAGTASFTVADGAILLTLPLRVDATARKDICLGIRKRGKCKGIKTHETGTSTAYVDAKALIALIVTKDYQIEVGSHVTQQLTSRPYLRMDLLGGLIPIKINIEGVVENLLERQEGKVTKALDKLLASQVAKLDLQATLARYWQKIRSPIKLGGAWISLDPQRILFKGIHQISEDQVALGFGIEGPTALSLTKPIPPAAKPMPPLAPAFGAQGFNLSVPLTSAFDDLTAQAKARLVGRSIKKANHWLTIEDISLSGASIKNTAGAARGTLVAAVTFKAGKGTEAGENVKAKGTLYLTFMPSINREKRTLEIIDVAASSDTLNLLDAAGVSWLNSQFTPEIMARLSYDYGAQIDKWKPKLNGLLRNGVPYKGFIVTGELADVDLGGFYVSGDRLEVYLSARGTVAATVDALEALKP